MMMSPMITLPFAATRATPKFDDARSSRTSAIVDA
jgi:hypothetical protein